MKTNDLSIAPLKKKKTEYQREEKLKLRICFWSNHFLVTYSGYSIIKHSHSLSLILDNIIVIKLSWKLIYLSIPQSIYSFKRRYSSEEDTISSTLENIFEKPWMIKKHLYCKILVIPDQWNIKKCGNLKNNVKLETNRGVTQPTCNTN